MIPKTLYFVNNGNAKSKDIENLIRSKKASSRKTGVNLELEINIVGEKEKFKKVLVIMGGTSGERPVSLETGKACFKALKKRL